MSNKDTRFLIKREKKKQRDCEDLKPRYTKHKLERKNKERPRTKERRKHYEREGKQEEGKSRR
jgi:hypothetical protein